MIHASANLDYKTHLNREDIDDLIEPAPAWRLSVFLPLENPDGDRRAGAAAQTAQRAQRAQRMLKDLRISAAAEIETRGLSSSEGADLLAPLDAILEAAGPGSAYQGNPRAGRGVALFSSEGMNKALVLPDPPEPMVELDRHFRLDPLLQALAGGDRFRLLELNLDSIRLWEGDAISMREISLGGMDTNINDALRRDDYPNVQSRFRVVGSAFKKTELTAFFRTIDQGLATRLQKDRTIPLILAGVGYFMPLYRDVNTYPRLSPLQIPGATHEPGTQEELHRNTSILLRDSWNREIRKSLDSYRENLATKRTVSGYTDTVPSAYCKSLTHLFVRSGSRQWGTFHPSPGKTELFDRYRPGAVNLSNLAAARTLMGHGKVMAVAEGSMPPGAGIAGLCRT